jgi:hypothetical protein
VAMSGNRRDEREPLPAAPSLVTRDRARGRSGASGRSWIGLQPAVKRAGVLWGLDEGGAQRASLRARRPAACRLGGVVEVGRLFYPSIIAERGTARTPTDRPEARV